MAYSRMLWENKSQRRKVRGREAHVSEAILSKSQSLRKRLAFLYETILEA
jgi:hypothetical protein